MENINVIGIDLAKQTFQVCAMTKQGKTVLNKKVTRLKLAEHIQKLPVCTIAMESCCGAHYWARRFQAMGHKVKLIAPHFVKPFVKSNKNDAHDSEAIAIAASQEHMRFVPTKTIEQQEIQGWHRSRELYVKQYTATANHIRALLLEHGMVIPKGVAHVKQVIDHLEDAQNELTMGIRAQLHQLYEHFKYLKAEAEALKERLTQPTQVDERIKYLKAEAEALKERLTQPTQVDERMQRLQTIPGIGPLTSSALVAAVGNGHEFKRGRELSAWLGLVPKQHSSGGRQKLMGISKRGDKYLRKLLVHGARIIVARCDKKQDKLSLWLQAKKQTLGFNKTAVALANKNARIAWALLAQSAVYQVNQTAGETLITEV